MATVLTVGEVVREALRLMSAHDQMRQAELEQPRRDVREGLASGPASAWDAEQIKCEARAARGLRTDVTAD